MTAFPRALVTGASGFIGGELVQAARARGWEVMGVGHARRSGSPSMRRVDLTVTREVEALVDEVEPQVVFHLAAQSARTADASSDRDQVELQMLDNLTHALGHSSSDPLLVTLGSAAEYGDAQVGRIDEDTPLAPAGAYGEAKVALERTALAGDLPVVWLRSFNVMGPGQPHGHPVSDWTWRLIECEHEGGGELRTGRLDVVRDFLDVRDVADAMLAASRLEPATVANLCSGVPTRLRDVVDRLTALATVPIELVPDPATTEGSPTRVVGDPSRFRALTGWSPGVPLERSLADGLEWARAQAPAAVR